MATKNIRLSIPASDAKLITQLQIILKKRLKLTSISKTSTVVHFLRKAVEQETFIDSTHNQ